MELYCFCKTEQEVLDTLEFLKLQPAIKAYRYGLKIYIEYIQED